MTTYVAHVALIEGVGVDAFSRIISMDFTPYVKEGDIEILGNISNFARIQLTRKGLFKVKEYLLRNTRSAEESIVNALINDEIGRTIDEELKKDPDKLHYLLNTENVRARPLEDHVAIPKRG